jgi:hypothetical protein
MAVYAGVDTFWMAHDNRGRLHAATKGIVQDGLVLNLDAGVRESYNGGDTWYDLSGNGNHGTLFNNPTYSSDNNGTFVFDGTNDYAEVPGDYHLFSELTIDFWFKSTNATPTGRPWGKGGDFEARFDGGSPGGSLTTDIGVTNYLISGTKVWGNTTWYNVVAVLLTSTTELYVQSELDATGNRSSITANTASLKIGKSASGFGSPFPGRISNFKIYNRALTPQEIQQNFNVTRKRFGI